MSPNNTGHWNVGHLNTGNDNTGDYNAGNKNVGNWNAGNRNTGNRNTGSGNTGTLNAGHCNVGKQNTGDWNTGDCNVGKWNTGDGNTGHKNTGNRNTGDSNTGERNTGERNTGNRNTGERNTGDCNAGSYNTGGWNTGDYNTGYCNSITPDDCLIFNKPSTRSAWDNAVKPKWMYVKLTKWVKESKMTDKEKEAYPSYVTTGGYLKVYTSLKHAYIEAWEKTTQEDRELTRQLPNFDEQVFQEVFGFYPWKSARQSVVLQVTDEQLEKIKNILEENN